MAGTTLERFGLAGLARATQSSLNWRNWRSPARRPSQKADTLSQQAMDKLIEAEIIPRLMLVNRMSAHEAELAAPTDSHARGFDAQEIDRFARKTIAYDHEALSAEVQALLRDGVWLDDILLKLLAPTARRLGQLWEEDLCDFTEVTIGLMKLHRVLETIGVQDSTAMGAGQSAPRVLLAPARGEQHMFGLVMVGELFSRSGWRVRCEVHADQDELEAIVGADHFDVIGFSASVEVDPKTLAADIKRVRAASINPDVAIMVGGQLFNEDLSLTRRVGADATATDGVRAVVTAERLVHRLTRSPGAQQH